MPSDLGFSDLDDWDRAFERETGLCVRQLLFRGSPCTRHLWEFGSDRCQICAEPSPEFDFCVKIDSAALKH